MNNQRIKVATLNSSILNQLHFSLSIKVVWLSLAFFLLALGSFYIFQINNFNKGFYSLETYQRQINTFSLENRNLEILFSQINSSYNLEKKISDLNFEKSNRISYIKLLESSVVINQNY